MKLREYQEKALNLLDDWLANHTLGNPCLVLPCGTGKSVILAAYCQKELKRWPDARILMLTHQKELIVQDANKLLAIWPEAPLGIYSASLKSKEIRQITYASIQSLYGHEDEIGHIDIVLVDEAHLVNHNDTGRYRKFLDALRPTVIIGLTATPYRLGHGLITDKPALFDALIEAITIKELQDQGYLAKLTSKSTRTVLDANGVTERCGDYVESDLARYIDVPLKTQNVVDEVISRADGRNHWLFFCCSVDHAEHVAQCLRDRGVKAKSIDGSLDQVTRDSIFEEFKSGELTALTNVMLATIGFDYPEIDLLVMMRPTLSPGLYVQQVGRGLRIKSNGGNCLVLDFAGNVATHGPITHVKHPKKKEKKQEGVAPCKNCPGCDEILPIQTRVCPECGYEFKFDRDLEFYLRYDSIMEGEGNIFPVKSWVWSVRFKFQSDEPMIVVTYIGRSCDQPIREYFRVWASSEKSLRWAMKRFNEITYKAGLTYYPPEPQELLALLNSLEPPLAIEYEVKEKYKNVKNRIWRQT